MSWLCKQYIYIYVAERLDQCAPNHSTTKVSTTNVSFAKEPYKRDEILQMRPMIVRSLRANDLINAHPVIQPHICSWIQELCGWILVSETYEWLNWVICQSHVCGSINDTCIYICGIIHAEWLKCHIYVAQKMHIRQSHIRGSMNDTYIYMLWKDLIIRTQPRSHMYVAEFSNYVADFRN